MEQLRQRTNNISLSGYRRGKFGTMTTMMKQQEGVMNEKHANHNMNRRKQKWNNGNGYNNHLANKVVLLIGNDTAVLQPLITQLAQKGADIALICQQLSAETVRGVHENVKSLGQRFMFLAETADQSISAANTIQTITSGLGHVDVFIDLSAQEVVPHNGNRTATEPFQPNWQFTQTVVEEIAHPA